MRVINVANLMTLQPPSEHPCGLSEHHFDALSTTDKPIIFAFHGYPWLIHRLTYWRHGDDMPAITGWRWGQEARAADVRSIEADDVRAARTAA